MKTTAKLMAMFLMLASLGFAQGDTKKADDKKAPAAAAVDTKSAKHMNAIEKALVRGGWRRRNDWLKQWPVRLPTGGHVMFSCFRR